MLEVSERIVIDYWTAH